MVPGVYPASRPPIEPNSSVLFVHLTFAVDGAPPLRRDPGRCADRASPNAGPLAEAAEQLIRQAPEVFPLRNFFGITVVFGETIPTVKGYDEITPILEVLEDVGMIEDERLTAWSRTLQRTDAGERYTVTIEPAAPDDARSAVGIA